MRTSKMKSGLEVRQGHWNCHRLIEHIQLHIDVLEQLWLYRSRVVSETFDVERCRDLEIRIRGHSRSLKVVQLDRSGMVSY